MTCSLAYCFCYRLFFNSCRMFIQNAASFGVEITMQQASALYFKEEYGLSAEACQAIASMFGWLNFFARGLGGVISDWANVRWGMRGRLWALTLMLLVEGAMVFVFSSHPSLAGALVSLVVFSLFVHFSEGAPAVSRWRTWLLTALEQISHTTDPPSLTLEQAPTWPSCPTSIRVTLGPSPASQEPAGTSAG
jgi:hypothetical protein